MTKIAAAVAAYESALTGKYEKMIENKWLWFVFALVVLVAVVLYGIYCTYVGKTFAWQVRLGVPFFFQMQVGCD